MIVMVFISIHFGMNLRTNGTYHECNIAYYTLNFLKFRVFGIIIEIFLCNYLLNEQNLLYNQNAIITMVEL